MEYQKKIIDVWNMVREVMWKRNGSCLRGCGGVYRAGVWNEKSEKWNEKRESIVV